MLLRRGDIVLVNFSPARPSEANYTRPAVVVTNNTANAHSPTVVVVPLTSNVSRVYHWQLVVPVHRSGLEQDSKIQPELVRHVSTDRIERVLGHLPEDLLEELDQKLRDYLAL